MDFIVEVTDVANDRHVLHFTHVFDADHVFVTSRGDEHIRRGYNILQQHNLKAVHSGLQRTNGISLGHFDPSTRALQGCRRAFANIAVATHNRDFTSQHCVRCTTNAIDERLFAPVLVVELRLSNGVVHVDRREGQLAVFVQIIQAMHASGRFLGHAADLFFHLGEPTGARGQTLGDLGLNDGLFLGLRDWDDFFTSLGAGTEQDVERRIAAIIKDQVWAFGEHERFVQVIPMLLKGLALDGENRHTGFGDCGGCVILG